MQNSFYRSWESYPFSRFHGFCFDAVLVTELLGFSLKNLGDPQVDVRDS